MAALVVAKRVHAYVRGAVRHDGFPADEPARRHGFLCVDSAAHLGQVQHLPRLCAGYAALRRTSLSSIAECQRHWLVHAGTFGGRLPERARNPKMRAFYFYLIFVYIHKLPQRNWLEAYKSGNGQYRCGRSTFDREVFPMASALADIIEEIDYSWRLDPHNHALPPFDKYITGIVDTCPVPLACPNDFHHASLYFQVSLS